ncbi:MAG TPA: allophanate hydrolase subunit 1 [Pseudonocardiaceae bacterium]|nr:allophanate hydrolase subunit 1 [Pseudonocardiaceae bacterium]
MRLRRCGSDAVLIEVDSLDEVDAVRAALAGAAESGRLPGLAELVPAARTVLAAMRPGSNGLAALREVLAGIDVTAAIGRDSREVVLPVYYDGPDLELVADTAGIGVAEVAALHSGVEYSVAFSGFAPGFGYLVGLPDVLCQPRLDRPRTKVPAGSVGIAGEFTGAYPRSSPGGWRLIGRTDAVLFDSHRDRPALLSPGDRVRFEARS